MATAIALVDCDNFFVSCERLFRPDLQRQPVLILSSNDGCVISRSNEAKALGIKMGVPYFTIRSLCEKYTIATFSSNFELYRDISDRVMAVLRRFSAVTEVYSIDEAFLTITPHEDSFTQRGIFIRDTVLSEVGVPISVGVSHTKTLAKCASHLAKPRHGGVGCNVLLEHDEITEALTQVTVDDVWGIGKRLALRLQKWNIHTAYDLTVAHDDLLRRAVHLPGVRTAQELRGTPHFTISPEPSVRKSLLHSQSFGTPVNDFTSLHGAVLFHVRSAVEMLRKERILAKKISVIAYTKFRNSTVPAHAYTEILPIYSNDTLLITKTVTNILRRVYQSNTTYKKAGVLLTDIVPVGYQSPATLFHEDTNENEVLMHTLDTLRTRFGDVVKIGGELGKKSWTAKSKYRSPCYTTRWSDVPHI